jgi:hypothetical protein
MEDAPVVDTAMRNFDVHGPERGFFYLTAAILKCSSAQVPSRRYPVRHHPRGTSYRKCSTNMMSLPSSSS